MTSSSAVVIEGSDIVLLSLKDAVQDMETQVASTLAAQDELNEVVKNLSEKLRAICNRDEPYDICAYLRKLQDCERRLSRCPERLNALNDRLGTLQRLIARETHAVKVELKQQQPIEKPEH